MADALFRDGNRGGVRWPGARRRMFAAALVALASVGALPIPAAGQAPREARRGAPHVLKPVESSAGVALVQVRAYCLEAGGNTPIVYVPDDEEKTRGSAEGKRLQRSLRPGAARAAAKALPFSAALQGVANQLLLVADLQFTH